MMNNSVDNNNSDTTTNSDTTNNSFQIRIKVNDGKSTTDLTLPSISPSTMTVGQLKQRILDAKQQKHKNGEEEEVEEPPQQYYLRLIVRGKMMAPDSTPLQQFGVVNNDVVHAVLLAMTTDVDDDDRGGGKQHHGSGGGGGGAFLLPQIVVGAAGGRGEFVAGGGGGGGQQLLRRGGEGWRPIVRVGRGQQARALRRLNNDALGSGGVGERGGGSGSRGGDVSTTPSGSGSSSWRSRQSLWRRIGINTNNNGHDDSGEEDDDDDNDEANNEVDLEMGNNITTRLERSDASSEMRSRRSVPTRDRRGFDRLRSSGMSREEVMAIRSYFASSVDRYIERRRAMMRATSSFRSSRRRVRERRGDGLIVNGASVSTTAERRSRRRTSTGESTNSLLDTTEDEENEDEVGSGGNLHMVGVEEDGRSSRDNHLTIEGGGSGGRNQIIDHGIAGEMTSTSVTTTTTLEGEEIFNDRPRMEDEWMAAQGPFSEFRMNLNTSNPLLMAAITRGGGFTVANGTGGPLDSTSPLGLFSRSRNFGLYRGLVNSTDDGYGDDDDEMFSGAFTSSGAFVHSSIGSRDANRPYAGPLPSAGTEKDFVWGFLLGFFVGFIMLFWVWMPSVPHRQKIGIILGISAQLGINLLRKGGRGDDAM